MVLSLSSPALRARPRSTAWKDSLRFAQAWIRNPAGIAAVAPSGRALARLITRDIGPDTGRILELGVGTGVFTRAMLDNGVAEHDLTLVECDGAFAHLLRTRFPAAHVLSVDARSLTMADTRGLPCFDATICGIGLLNMTPADVASVLAGSFSLMRPTGRFFLFTYGRCCSVAAEILGDLGLEATRVGATLRNIPPASVYRINRRKDGMGAHD